MRQDKPDLRHGDGTSVGGRRANQRLAILDPRQGRALRPVVTPPFPEHRPGEGWRAQAACVGGDVELFFPLGAAGAGFEQAERAKEICGRCDVSQQCLEWALRTHQDAGVWGGLTEDERRVLRRRRRRRQTA